MMREGGSGYDARGGAVAMMREGGSGYDARGGQGVHLVIRTTSQGA